MMDKYILVNGKPVKEPCLLKWGEWFEHNPNRVIAQSLICDVWVSTVFLSIDHNFTRHGEPVLFETMIFHGKYDQYQRRYHNIQQSKTGHIKVVIKAVWGLLLDIILKTPERIVVNNIDV